MASYNFNVVVKDGSGTAVVGATVTVYKSDGTTAGTGLTIAGGVLTANLTLDTANNTHYITVTKTAYQSYAQYYEIAYNDTSFYIRLPAYSTTYCTPLQSAKFIFGDTFTFAGTTKLTDSTVADLIIRNEQEIDSFLMTSFKNNTVSNEYQNLTRSGRNSDGFLPVYTRHKPLRTKDATWKIENFDGATYIDFVTGKTEGRANDYWIDYDKSVLYINPLSYGDQYLRLTYTWGYSSVPKDIEKLCILKTALNLLDMDDYVGLIQTGDQSLMTKRDSYVKQIWMLEKHLTKLRF